DLGGAGISQPGKRHMRGELAGVGWQAEPLADTLDFRLQALEIGRRGDARPYGMGFLAAEGADARKRQWERGPPHPVKGVGDFVSDMAFDVADETERDVVVLHVDPSCAGEAAAQQRK